MSLWGGRFATGPNESVAKLSRSVHFDWRLAPYDIRVNVAHVAGLQRAGVIKKEDAEQITTALNELAQEVASGSFTYIDSDEDVHSAIERGLVGKLGALGGALRAGRSRNDLVVTDFKLYLIDHLLEVAHETLELTQVLDSAATKQMGLVAPGFTHLQHAQPILFSHELAKHSHSLLRDVDRVKDWLTRNSVSPLGSGALAGSSLVPNPEIIAAELAFQGVTRNSIDAVSDRDFVAEALFIFAMLGVHLSRIGEEFTIWNTQEFGWVTLDDAFSTGSSIMPQKKNPDIAELARGKAGRFIGNLTSLLVTLKGLPFAYNRDLQEDKEPVFDSVEELLILLPAVRGMIETATFNSTMISAGVLDGHALATEIADFLVRSGAPFAQAHEISGKAVALAESKGLDVHELTDAEFAGIDARLTGELRTVLSAQAALDSRTSINGTSSKSVTTQLAQLDTKIRGYSSWIASERKRFSGMMGA
ncbi:MAG: argininosuccinate lyase [Actinomycetes bacterium]|jgi:argininosuccinate lyase